MKISTKLLTAFFIGFTVYCNAQVDTYNYKRDLSKITDTWHEIKLPNTIVGKIKSNVSDVRIYGITEVKDTIEAPYFLEILSENVVRKAVPFHIINKTKGEKGYYFTFKLNSEALINQIHLNFKEDNFDWKVELQGSQNQQEWFTILNDYRILAIKNEATHYRFTKLEFPETKYQFYRLLVKHIKQPQLESAQLFQHDVIKGEEIDYQNKNFKIEGDNQLKVTIINLELAMASPVSSIKVDIGNTFDYYRPLKIEYRNDSIQTEKGWKYMYKTVTSGTLNSLESNLFNLPNTIAKHLRITIYNGDNHPLTITNLSAKGYAYRLISRFTEPANYMLVYGNPSARKPLYDINKFETKVPTDLKKIDLGVEEIIYKPKQLKTKPLFENQYWLWIIIGVVILIISGFTFNMLKKKG